MNPGDAYWKLVEPIWNSISIESAQRFASTFNSVRIVPRTLYAAHFCQSEVCNGGFHQFFYNSTGVLAPEASAAFATIGMPQTSAVIQRALSWFGDPYPRQKNLRVERLRAANDLSLFSPLDQEFFELWGSENGGFLASADAYALW